jgi:hypothetical protein
MMQKIDFTGILARAKAEIGDCVDGKEYLDFIRQNPCIVCGRRAEPHHMKTRGAGGSDFLAVPLCREHHTEIGHGTLNFLVKYKIDIRATIFELLRDYYGM